MSRARPMSRQTGGRAVIGVLALLGAATACDVEPPPPPPVLLVQMPGDRPDAAPGDGVCETDEGSRECTLRAAIEEGNALGRAVLELQDLQWTEPYYGLEAPIEVTGSIHIRGAAPDLSIGSGDAFASPDQALHVGVGASLTIEGVDVAFLGLRVEGTLVISRSRMITWGEGSPFGIPGGTIDVAPGGAALVQNGWLTSFAADPVRNDGTLMLDNSTVGTFWSSIGTEGVEMGGIRTGPGAATHLRATWVASGTCSGTAPVSMGYNAAVGTSCGLTGPTDQQDAPTMFDYVLEPPTGSLVDAIPLGEAGCGTVSTDLEGVERPRDGNGDGIAACDVGAREA